MAATGTGERSRHHLGIGGLVHPVQLEVEYSIYHSYTAPGGVWHISSKPEA